MFTIPKAAAAPASSVRNPAYLATSTQSVKINITPHGSGTSLPGYPITANLTATSTGCTSTAVSTQCTITATASVGNDDVTIVTYDGLNGTGSELSAAQTIEITVTEGTANVVPISLGGIPATVKVKVGTATGGSQGLVFTLTPNASGTLLAYGVDADGNVILGAGAPTITVSNTNPSAYTVTTPSASAPNTIPVASLLATAAGSITRVTVTATPVAGTGTGPVSATVTLQAPTLGIIYTANYPYSKVSVYDALGNSLTPPGNFPGVSEPYNITYDSQNQDIYVLDSAGAAIAAYDRSGYQQPLSPGFTVSGTLLGLTYDPQNNLLYTISESGAVAVYTAGGSATSVSPGTFSGAAGQYGFSYDPHNGYLYEATGSVAAWDTNGNAEVLTGGFPGLSQTTGITYNAFDNDLYVACVYPSQILVYTENGSTVTVSGSWTGSTGTGSTNQPFSIGSDPASGNVYVTTNADNLIGYDENGNVLWTVSGSNSSQGIAVAPPP